MIQSIAHAAITVRDMEESIRFYTEALGFTKAFEMEFPIEKDLWEKADEYIMVLIRAHTLFPCEKAKSVRLNEY